jgi:hypothetical protein
MDRIKVISQEIEVGYSGQKLVVVTWIPFSEDPNEFPRVTVFDYFWADRGDIVVLHLLSHTRKDTREKVRDVHPDDFKEVRVCAASMVIDEEESW